MTIIVENSTVDMQPYIQATELTYGDNKVSPIFAPIFIWKTIFIANCVKNDKLYHIHMIFAM